MIIVRDDQARKSGCVCSHRKFLHIEQESAMKSLACSLQHRTSSVNTTPDVSNGIEQIQEARSSWNQQNEMMGSLFTQREEIGLLDAIYNEIN